MNFHLRTIPDIYAQKLVDEGIMTAEEVQKICKDQFDYFAAEMQIAESFVPEESYFQKQWEGFVQAPSDITIWDTGVSWDLLSFIGRSSVHYPANFVSCSFLRSSFKFKDHNSRSDLKIKIKIIFKIKINILCS